MVTVVPGQEGAYGNVAEKTKVKEYMEANLEKLLKYNAWLKRWSSVRGSSMRKKMLSIDPTSKALGALKARIQLVNLTLLFIVEAACGCSSALSLSSVSEKLASPMNTISSSAERSPY
ncbi:hypothetical protein Tco_1515240 [Tanacetum coccineum]